LRADGGSFDRGPGVAASGPRHALTRGVRLRPRVPDNKEKMFLPRNLLVLVYVGVGLVVAATHHYFSNINGWRGVVSAILAVALWPLILLGINLHIKK
jgi:hypothetical protein